MKLQVFMPRALAWPIERKHRYEALSQAALKAGAVALLTAHHAQDQFETMLLRLARDAGKANSYQSLERTPATLEKRIPINPMAIPMIVKNSTANKAPILRASP